MKAMIYRVTMLGLPVAIGFVSQAAIAFTDALLVARLGVTELAGAVPGLGIFSFVMLFGLGIITAATPNIAAAHKNRDITALQCWFAQAIWLSLILGAAGMIVLVNTTYILELFGQDSTLATIAGDYNQGAALGLPFFFIHVAIRGLMSAVGRPQPLTVIMLVAIPVNFMLAYGAIFGFAFIPPMGVFGAGLSGALIRGIIIAASFWVLLKNPSFHDLRLSSCPFAISLPHIASLLKTGTPIGLRILSGEGILPAMTLLITAYGADATATHAVAERLLGLLTIMSLGFSSAAISMTSWLRAEHKMNDLYRLRRALMIISLIYVAITGGMLMIGFNWVIRYLFNINTPQTLALLHIMLPLIVPALLFDTIATILGGCLIGLKDTFIPSVFVISCYWIIGLGGGIILAAYSPLGFVGFWAAMIAAYGTNAIFNYIRTGQQIAQKTQTYL